MQIIRIKSWIILENDDVITVVTSGAEQESEDEDDEDNDEDEEEVTED